jgi:hypothetical protein
MAMTAAGMAAKIKAAMTTPAMIALAQTSDSATAVTNADTAMLAMCQGIINEIVANSELVSVTHDAGAAGAGIITGTVK